MTQQFPKDALRRKLVVAGVPEVEHDRDALAAKIPDFDLGALQDATADTIAELVLYLISKGIVSLPVVSDRALLDLPWGAHVCHFYQDPDELLRLLVPYFKQGLERNEACVWLLSDITAEQATAALGAAVPDLQRHLASGQMLICHYTDLYTQADGSVKPSDELSAAFTALGSSVAAQGYAGLRASGGVSWIHDAVNMSRFMDYETKVNLAIQSSRIMAVCTYPAHAAALQPCRELIHNHGRVFVQRGEWVHDRSRDAQLVEAIFTSLTAQTAPPPAVAAAPRAALAG